MKISKVINEPCYQFELTQAEVEVIQMALGDYYCFLEYSLKNNHIRSNSSEEEPFSITDKIKKRFSAQFKILEPMIEMVDLL